MDIDYLAVNRPYISIDMIGSMAYTRAPCILRRTTVNNVPFKMIIEDLIVDAK